jgi:starch phosphorylase
MGLERIRELVEDGAGSLEEAIGAVKRNTVLTTHTPVPAGNEAFETHLIRKYYDAWCKRIGISSDSLLALGRAPNGNGDELFNLTALGIRLCSEFNGVSRLHAATTGELWRGLWPESEHPPVRAITNGVHFPTWLGREMRAVYERYLDPEWELRHSDPAIWQRAYAIPPAELWSAHLSQKLLLIKRSRGRIREQYARHGRAPDALAAVEKLLDPNVLMIGFARRFATYKRADLVFRDLERIRSILTDPARPVHLIFAGKAHPADRPGQELIRRLWQLAESIDLGDHIVFLEDYDLAIGRQLVQGVDVWLNTPRRPLEASGTSGMKAALNGALNLSILDGWWDEAYDGRNGWAFGAREPIDDSSGQDHFDAQSLYQILAEEVVPLFYQRDAEGLPEGWIERVLHSVATIGSRFSTDRMLQEYFVNAYLPAANRSESSPD